MNSRYIIEANISKYSKMLKAEVKSTVTIEKYYRDIRAFSVY